MTPELPQGLFFRDTRFLSLMRLRVNGATPEPLAATTPDPFSGAFVLRDHPKAGRADSNLMVFRHRYVGRGMREDIVVHNFAEEPAFSAIELAFDCDFADLFEVKEGRVEKLGDLSVQSSASRITFRYRRGAFQRASHVDFSVEPRISETTATYEVIVPARGDWTHLHPVDTGDRRAGDHAAVSVRSLGRAHDAGRAARRVAPPAPGRHERPRPVPVAARALDRRPRRVAHLRSRLSPTAPSWPRARPGS